MKNPDYEGDMSYYQKQLEEKGITKDMLNMDMYVGLTVTVYSRSCTFEKKGSADDT